MPGCGSEPGTLTRPNMPGCSMPSLLSKRARTPHRAGRLVEAVFGEIQLALERGLLAVGEADRRRRARRRPPACVPPRVPGVARIGEIGCAHRCRNRNRSDRARRSWSAASESGWTRLPAETSRRSMRPASGALICGEFEIEAGMAQRGLRALMLRPGRPGIRAGGRPARRRKGCRTWPAASARSSCVLVNSSRLVATSTCDFAAS